MLYAEEHIAVERCGCTLRPSNEVGMSLLYNVTNRECVCVGGGGIVHGNYKFESSEWVNYLNKDR